MTCADPPPAAPVPLMLSLPPAPSVPRPLLPSGARPPLRRGALHEAGGPRGTIAEGL